MALTHSLLAAATLLIVAATTQYFVFDQLMLKTIVVAHILFILSAFSDHHSRRIAVVTLGLAVVVLIEIWRSYVTEDSALGFFVFNLVIFIFLACIAYHTLRKR